MLSFFRRDFKEREPKRGDDRLKREQDRRTLKISTRDSVDEGDLPFDWAHQKVALGKPNPLGRAADVEDIALGGA
ncbi:MAG: hypothetical protein L0I29_03855 [Hyphomicrobiales bacterium]|nr:hypothetical protein [Hyphomicrobiales bacterium]